MQSAEKDDSSCAYVIFTTVYKCANSTRKYLLTGKCPSCKVIFFIYILENVVKIIRSAIIRKCFVVCMEVVTVILRLAEHVT